ncbi:MAG: type I-F CRISPR-associated endoribonuclease Cas6/Csy4 [Deltaproteobacteria bacterium]|nr:type I-F CRISPR-associated endoribonuclease Cas6/Csy4 [Deltaproteobacteria bacterium]
MDYYIDIEIKPDPEMRESPLMNLVYTKFHKALVKLGTDQIGVSFPGYKIKLGRLLRLHGDKTNLHNLQGLNWLGGVAGYCEISDVKNVPLDVKYRIISRIRTNMSKSKLERLKRRGSITPVEEKAYKAKMFSQGLDNPYLDLESGSTGEMHRRFIHFGPLLDHPVADKFDSYGLSKVATAPWF